MNLIFDTWEYELIPEPRRTWVMAAVREAMQKLPGREAVVVPAVAEQEYVFRVERGTVPVIMRSFGSSPAEAARKLGLPADPTLDYRTVEEAITEGWIDNGENLMGV